jgi:diguanylate cyclase (GGDEF)-like protein
MSLLIVLSLSIVVKIIKEQETSDHLQETVKLQSLFVDRWRAERASDIRYLAGVSSQLGADLARMKVEFDQFVHTHKEFDAISYMDAKGVIQWNSTGAVGMSIGDRDYFIEAMLNRNSISDIMISRLSGKYVIIFASPVVDMAGTVTGVMSGTVGISTLDALMSEFQPGMPGETYILNQIGVRITQSSSEMDLPRLSRVYGTTAFERAQKNRQETSSYLNEAGTRVFGAFSWTQDHAWIVVTEVNSAEVYRPYYTMIIVMVIITLAILLISYFIAIVLTRKMEVLINDLVDGTTSIREGHYGYQIDPQIIDNSPDELKELSYNFNVMSQKLQSTVLLLEESAVIDHLTEVYNRRFLMNEGNKMQMASLRAGASCCVLLIDVDFFKLVNDRYGHLIGDRVLKHIAQVLVGCVRTSDVVSRYGGEEFVVLATNCDLMRGQELAERIRTWVENAPYEEDTVSIQLSVSIGVTQNSETRVFGTNVLEDMIERADKALYKAKHRGRNNVVAEPLEYESVHPEETDEQG